METRTLMRIAFTYGKARVSSPFWDAESLSHGNKHCFPAIVSSPSHKLLIFCVSHSLILKNVLKD